MRLAELDRPEQEKNFPRKIMPQIRQPDLDDGPFSYKLGNISVSNLKPVQKQRVKGLKDKAKRGFDDGSIRPIIIDKNNFIVNGHHRYDVALELDLDKIKAIRVDATIEDLIDHYTHKARDEKASELYADTGGAGAGAGGDGGTASSSGDGGSADSGDTGSSDSAPTSDAPVARGFFGIGTMPSRKKKKKKKSFKFGGSIYETLEAAQDLNALLQGIEADLEQREKDLKKLPKKSIYEDIEPNYHFEWDEAQRYPEFKKLGKEKWIELAQKGKIVKIKDASKINNTDAGSPEEFYNLDKDKQKRALQQIARNDVEMPIIARYSDNYLELIGGNTRLTAMMLRKGYANVWIFNVPDEVAELAENFVSEGVRENFAKLKQALSTESGESKQMMDIYRRAMKKQASPEEIKTANKQFKDMLKLVGLGSFIAGTSMIPASGAAIFPVEKFLNTKFGISILPNGFKDAFPPALPKSLHKVGDKVTLDGATYDVQKVDANTGTVDVKDQSGKVWTKVKSTTFFKQVPENFADGKVKGKSRPGRVKKAGASCKGSVTSLRAKAKKYSGEKGKMYHWCANMKGGKKK